MPHADFVHLRVHTAYSLSQGAVRIDGLAEICKRQAMPAVAITDTGNLFGVLEFATTMSKAGVQPIVGCILSIRRAAAQPGRPGGNGAAPDQLLLLVQDATGYRNLLALVSKAYLETEPH